MARSDVESLTGAIVDLNEKTPIRVLHVDDEPSFLKIARECLTAQGELEVVSVSSVEEAMKKINERKFDVIVSDYQMPGRDGLAFLKELRKDGNNIPFIMFTGKGREEVAINALNYGADQYFGKIGDPETVYYELAHGIRQAVERKRAEEMLRESEEKYRNLVENSKDSIVIIDLNGNVRFANKATGELSGYSMSEGIGMNVRKITPLRYWAKSLAMLKKARKGKPIPYFESVIRRKDGRPVPVESGGQPIFKNGEVMGVQIITRDITDRKRAAEVLRESEEKYRRLANQLPLIIFEVDDHGDFTFVNRRGLEISGYSQKDLKKGMNILETIAPEDRDRARKNIQKILGGNTLGFNEYEILRKDGSRFPAIAHTSTIIRENGAVGLRGVVVDITERKKADRTIRENQLRFERLFTYNPEATCHTDAALHILDVNPRFIELFGYSAEEIKGKNLNDVVVPEDKLEEGERLDKKAQEGYTHFDTVRKRRDGSLVPVSMSASSIIIDQKLLGYVVTYKEISDRKKSEQAILESQQKFEGLFIHTPEPTCYVDANFHIVDVNPRFEELFGYSREEIKGAHINDLVVQRDKIEEATMLEERAKQGLVYFDTVRKKKDGSLIPVSISVAPMISEGKLLGYIAIYKDVSESRRAEETLKALNEKLQVVGSLTRHDIRNRLAVLYAYIFQLRKRLSQDEKAMQDLAEMELSSKQILRILEFSRAYEKLGTEEPGRINVERCFNDAVSLFSDLRGVRVLNECGGLSLLADSLLTQIFYNLIDNSLKYGERLTQIKISYEKAPNMVRLIYEDDGVGISESVRGNLFKDGCGRGTGHGLYLIRKICETYGWTINETGILGRGVRFTVSIPKTSNNNQRQLYTLG